MCFVTFNAFDYETLKTNDNAFGKDYPYSLLVGEH